MLVKPALKATAIKQKIHIPMLQLQFKAICIKQAPALRQ